GGYIVHFDVVVIVVGLSGAAFNQQKEQELGFHEQMQIGPYTLVCDTSTEEENPNYQISYAILNVYKNGKPIGQMFPARKFFKASQQPDTIVANHRSEEHTSELQSRRDLVCRLLLEKKKKKK